MKRLIAIFSITCFLTQSGAACVCGDGIWTTESAYNASKLVVYGTVLNISVVSIAETMDSVLLEKYFLLHVLDSSKADMLFYPMILKAELQIKNNFKGADSLNTVIIYSPVQGATCGFLFVPGNDYIVYDSDSQFIYQFLGFGSNLQKGKTYWTNNCTNTNRSTETHLQELTTLKESER